jgi:hypothetical protein
MISAIVARDGTKRTFVILGYGLYKLEEMEMKNDLHEAKGNKHLILQRREGPIQRNQEIREDK